MRWSQEIWRLWDASVKMTTGVWLWKKQSEGIHFRNGPGRCPDAATHFLVDYKVWPQNMMGGGRRGNSSSELGLCLAQWATVDAIWCQEFMLPHMSLLSHLNCHHQSPPFRALEDRWVLTGLRNYGTMTWSTLARIRLLKHGAAGQASRTCCLLPVLWPVHWWWWGGCLACGWIWPTDAVLCPAQGGHSVFRKEFLFRCPHSRIRWFHTEI